MSQETQLLIVDRDKCKKDGICAAECPVDLIYYNDAGYPLIRKAAKRQCVRCGHCVAVCPTQALQLNLLPSEPPQMVDTNLLPKPEAVAHLIQSRRSVRVFRKKQIERTDLEWLLEIARYAPSAHNAQPVRWIIINNAEKVRQLAEHVIDWMEAQDKFPSLVRAWRQNAKDTILRKAPCLAIAYAQTTSENPMADCSIAVSSMELAAHAKNIGACWAGFLMSVAAQSDILNTKLNLPDGHQIYGALMLGYPKFKYQLIPNRNPAHVHWIE